MKNLFNRELFGATAFGLLSFLVALTLSWILLAQQNFWYVLWHDHAGIGQAIDKYGPQNRYIRGFADTTREQRVQAFAEINRAVHQGGKGLAQITFETPRYGVQQLLREPEVVHLEDVAKLISFLKYVVLGVFVTWLITLVFIYRKQRLPPLREQFLGTGIFIACSAILVFLIGPKKVFNTLHVWVFPKENAWFFYYQDSLMSTLMEAPYLFGWIAVTLLAWAIVFYFLLQLAIYTISSAMWRRAS